MPLLNASLNGTQSLNGMRRTYEVAARTLRGKTDDAQQAGEADQSFQALRASAAISAVREGGQMLAATQIYSRGLDDISGSLEAMKNLAAQAGASGSGSGEPLKSQFHDMKASIAAAATSIGLDTTALGIDGAGISEPSAAALAISSINTAAGQLGNARTAVQADQQQLGQALGRAHTGPDATAALASSEQASDMADWLASQMQLGTSAIPAQANVTGAGVKALLRY